MLKIVASLTDDYRGVIYDCNIFIIQASRLNDRELFIFVNFSQNIRVKLGLKQRQVNGARLKCITKTRQLNTAVWSQDHSTSSA